MAGRRSPGDTLRFLSAPQRTRSTTSASFSRRWWPSSQRRGQCRGWAPGVRARLRPDNTSVTQPTPPGGTTHPPRRRHRGRRAPSRTLPSRRPLVCGRASPTEPAPRAVAIQPAGPDHPGAAAWSSWRSWRCRWAAPGRVVHRRRRSICRTAGRNAALEGTRGGLGGVHDRRARPHAPRAPPHRPTPPAQAEPRESRNASGATPSPGAAPVAPARCRRATHRRLPRPLPLTPRRPAAADGRAPPTAAAASSPRRAPCSKSPSTATNATGSTIRRVLPG